MKRFGWSLFVLLFAMQPIILLAQGVERPNPWFTLSITEKDITTDGSAFPEDHILLVTYTNISDAVEFIPSDLHITLNMIVLHDGAPAEETEGMRALRKEREDLASGNATPSSVQTMHSLKPGASITFPWEISGYFDMSKPGTYTITVNRETFPWEPAKGVLIDLDQVGTGLLANDTGGDITGYRIDIYKGVGKAVCANYNNIMAVGACNPATSGCPASAVQ